MVRTAERYLRQTHARSMHSTSGVCVCCLASNGTNLYGMMMYGRRRLTKQPKLTAIIQLRRLALIGHIMRMDDNADAKRILLVPPLVNWRRQPGCPHITWLSTIQQDLKQHHHTLPKQWRSQKFAKGGQNRGSEGWKSPCGVQGQSPGGDLGAKPPEAGDIY